MRNLVHGFGAAVPEPSAGVLTHDRGPSFSLGSDSPSGLASGRRPARTLMPVMVTEGDRLAWVTVAMRGKARPRIHTRPARRRSHRRDGAVSAAMVWRGR
ncbi:hypothetical protein DKM19_14020 [Streptosporangium sp. 'caverna']|nr:hypothetical protein DKM19_14020 [Streptosporangium sp. 'caverna']